MSASNVNVRKRKLKRAASDQPNQQPLEVYCRLRPLKSPADSIAITPLSDEVLQATAGNDLPRVYKFKHIFQSGDPQKEIFRLVGFPFVKDLLAGQNGLLFTYGVTSSGKTFTITGEPDCPGILPRTLDVLFDSLKKHELLSSKFTFKSDNQNGFETVTCGDIVLRQLQNEVNQAVLRKFKSPSSPAASSTSSTSSIASRKTRENEWHARLIDDNLWVKEGVNTSNYYAVFISFVEVYNNYVYDLLEKPNETGKLGSIYKNMPQSKGVREDAKKRCYVQGVVETEVTSADQAIDLFVEGLSRRRVASTKLNAESSRSHSVFTIRLVQAPKECGFLTGNKDSVHVSQLSIVDLAGCERAARTNAVGNRLKEASNINNSLLTLRNCFDTLRENQGNPGANKVVPYRDSKLTHLFKSYFEGEGAVKMVVCLNPDAHDLDENLQVLKFGEQSQEIVTSKGYGATPAKRALSTLEAVGAYNTPLIDLLPLDNGRKYDFGPVYPKQPQEHEEEEEENNNRLTQWTNVAQTRKLKYRELQEEQNKILTSLGAELKQNEDERRQLAQERARLQNDVKARDRQLAEMQLKMAEMERHYEALCQQEREQDVMADDVMGQIAIREQVSAQLQFQLNEMRRTTTEHLVREKDRISKQCLQTLSQFQSKLEQEKCLQEDKLNEVARILQADNVFELELLRQKPQ